MTDSIYSTEVQCVTTSFRDRANVFRSIQEWLKVGVCGPAQEVAMAMLHVWSALDFTFLAVKLTALT